MSSSLDPSSFTWATGDPSIATVDQNGVIRLKSKGNTTVTATEKKILKNFLIVSPFHSVGIRTLL